MNPPDTVVPAPPLEPELLAEIHALTDDAAAIIARHPRAGEKEFAPLAARRRALLARHLGRDPGENVEPVHVLGDSNTILFAGCERLAFSRYRSVGLFRKRWINRGPDLLPVFRTYHLGPTTAWKAGDYGSSTRGREKIDLLLRREIKPPARLLLSFGEIDCRVHMSRAALDGKPVAELVERTAEKFIAFPLMLRRHGYRPAVWGPPQIVPKDEKYKSPDFPFVGSLEHRRDITFAYIERLTEHCARHDIPCVCMVGHYHPWQERIPKDFFYDGAHLSQRLMPLTLKLLGDAGALPW